MMNNKKIKKLKYNSKKINNIYSQDELLFIKNRKYNLYQHKILSKYKNNIYQEYNNINYYSYIDPKDKLIDLISKIDYYISSKKIF